MSDRTSSLAPGTLWQRIRTQTQQALEYGALQPIVTERQVVEDEGVGFQVRVVSSLAQKEQERKRQADKHKIAGVDQNPFLSPEDALNVGDISDTHTGVLNKFNVIDHHRLVATVRPTRFEPLNRDGIYVFRFFDVANADVEEIATLSLEAWTYFETSGDYAAQPQGLFAPVDRREERGTMMLTTWYDDLTSWSTSRQPDERATANFQRRHTLTRGSIAYATRLVGH